METAHEGSGQNDTTFRTELKRALEDVDPREKLCDGQLKQMGWRQIISVSRYG